VKEFREELEEAKRASVAQLLFRCARLWNEQAILRVRRVTGMKGFRQAHTTLFPHISLEGTRLTEIAARLDVSKQAVAPLVDEMVAMGALEKIPDPDDGRARLIRFTEQGQGEMMQGLGVLLQLQEEMTNRLGEERMANFHETLLLLQDELERRPLEEE
jgi:DNA-binding MarR family transcriptional regulator